MGKLYVPEHAKRPLVCMHTPGTGRPLGWRGATPPRALRIALPLNSAEIGCGTSSCSAGRSPGACAHATCDACAVHVRMHTRVHVSCRAAHPYDHQRPPERGRHRRRRRKCTQPVPQSILHVDYHPPARVKLHRRGRERALGAFVERARAVKTRGRGSNLWAQRPRWGILLAASLEKLERLERVNRPGQLLHACRHGQGRSDYISPSSSRSMLSGHMLWA